jgi:hypothetical protein
MNHEHKLNIDIPKNTKYNGSIQSPKNIYDGSIQSPKNIYNINMSIICITDPFLGLNYII